MRPEQQDEPWHRLERRTVTVTAILMAGVAVLAGVPTTIGVGGATSLPMALAWVIPGALLLIGGGCLADYLRWRKTRYRITGTHVEVHKGILFTSRLRLSRDRIRAVDVTAHPVLRWFGLVVLSVGTGEQGGGGAASQTIVLNPITKDAGDTLQDALLDQPGGDGGESGTQRLATWRPVWTRYAPLSIVTVLLAAAVIGGTFQIFDWFGRGELPVVIVTDLAAQFGWPAVIGIGLAALTVLAVLLAVAFYLELWWRYHLERETGGTLRVRRGLLTTRSISLEEERIRGVHLVEPLGIRMAGAARLQVVATGLGSDAQAQSEISTLLPSAPRAAALEVSKHVIGVRPDAGSLTGHPRGARTRRLRWAAMVLTGLLGCWLALFALSAPQWLLGTVAALALASGAALPVLAWDAARNLGHEVTPVHLTTRYGSIRRSTVLLQREGIIGWRLRQSVFQRRLGLASLTAVTAAGRGHYTIIDGGTGQIQSLTEELVAGFLVPRGSANND